MLLFIHTMWMTNRNRKKNFYPILPKFFLLLSLQNEIILKIIKWIEQTWKTFGFVIRIPMLHINLIKLWSTEKKKQNIFTITGKQLCLSYQAGSWWWLSEINKIHSLQKNFYFSSINFSFLFFIWLLWSIFTRFFLFAYYHLFGCCCCRRFIVAIIN